MNSTQRGVIDTWAGETTPEDAAATITLLRAPGAIGAAFFLGGAVVGQAVWSTATAEATAFAVLRCLAVAFVRAVSLALAPVSLRPDDDASVDSRRGDRGDAPFDRHVRVSVSIADQ